MNPAAWRPPAADLTFPLDRIDVWRVRVAAEGMAEEEWRSILAADEAARAARFHFDRDRNRYRRGRTALTAEFTENADVLISARMTTPLYT